jgi:arginase
LAIVEAPSSLGLSRGGVEQLSARLLRNGLADRLKARYAGAVEPLHSGAERDTETLALNAREIAEWSPRLADTVGDVLDRGEFPLILGGDCSILLGSALALKRRGRFGLLFLDGHADFYQPEVNPNGEVASMELAFATGHGPDLLSDLEGRRPLFRADDVVAIGFRDQDEQRAFGSQPLPREMFALDLLTVRRIGPARAMTKALQHMTRPGIEGFFIHFDADCLADDIMPAVDYRLPGGFTWDEIATVLTAALASGRSVGMELTIYNPELDADGTAGRELVNALADVFHPFIQPGTPRRD